MTIRQNTHMMNIVVFLIQYFQDIGNCPDRNDLGEMLEHAGFDGDEIGRLLFFIELLNEYPIDDRPYTGSALRVYCAEENLMLPPSVRGLLHFLVEEGELSPAQREFIIHALMHLPYEDVTLENAKMLAVLVLWAQRCALPVRMGGELTAAVHNGMMH